MASAGRRPAPAATVVHLKRKNGVVVVSCDVYIGRAMYRGGWQLPASKWANPFRLGRDGDRAEVLRRYEAHVRTSPELVGALPELRGRRLGCWCVGPRCVVCGRPRGACAHPNCHGDILVGLLAELAPPEGETLSDAEARGPEPTSPVPDDDPLWAELGL